MLDQFWETDPSPNRKQSSFVVGNVAGGQTGKRRRSKRPHFVAAVACSCAQLRGSSPLICVAFLSTRRRIMGLRGAASVVSAARSRVGAATVVPPPGAAKAKAKAGGGRGSGARRSSAQVSKAASPAASSKKPKLSAEQPEASPSSGAHDAADESWMGKDGSVGPCLACNAQPSADFVFQAQRGSGKRVLVGRSCGTCYNRCKDGWPHLTFPQFAERIATAEGADELRQYNELRQNGEVDFLTSEVTNETRVDFVMSRSYIAMCAAEYRKTFGRDPLGARGPRVPTVRLPSESGAGSEEHWLFLDPQRPHRHVTVQVSMGDRLSATALSHADNKYEKMASNIWNSSRVRRQEENMAGTALFRQGIALPEVASHMERVNPDLFQETLGSHEASSSGQVPTTVPQPPLDMANSAIDSGAADMEGSFIVTGDVGSKFNRQLTTPFTPVSKKQTFARAPTGLSPAAIREDDETARRR